MNFDRLMAEISSAKGMEAKCWAAIRAQVLAQTGTTFQGKKSTEQLSGAIEHIELLLHKLKGAKQTMERAMNLLDLQRVTIRNFAEIFCDKLNKAVAPYSYGVYMDNIRLQGGREIHPMLFLACPSLENYRDMRLVKGNSDIRGGNIPELDLSTRAGKLVNAIGRVCIGEANSSDNKLEDSGHPLEKVFSGSGCFEKESKMINILTDTDIMDYRIQITPKTSERKIAPAVMAMPGLGVPRDASDKMVSALFDKIMREIVSEKLNVSSEQKEPKTLGA